VSHDLRLFGEQTEEYAASALSHMKKCDVCGIRVGFLQNGDIDQVGLMVLEWYPDCETVFVSSVMET
jgi:hypothetical protein